MANRIKLKGTTEKAFDLGLSNKFTLDATGFTADRTWILPNSNGSNGQVLSTNGSGVLSWVNQTGGGGGSTQARIQFTAASSAAGQTFTDSGLSTFTNNTFANVFVNGVLLQTSEYSISSTTLTVSRYLSTGDNIVVAATGAGSVVGTLATTSGGTGLSTYTTGDIIYASGTNTLAKLPIGTSNQVLTVSGGVPSWQTPSGGTKQYLFATLTLQIINGTSTPVDIIFGTQQSISGLTYNTGTGVVTLTANRTYRLHAGGGRWNQPINTTGTDSLRFGWVDAASNTELFANIVGSMGGDVSGGSAPSNQMGGGSLEIIYTPTTNQTVKLRALSGGTAQWTWQYGQMIVQEL
jgi:hypothetical protein